MKHVGSIPILAVTDYRDALNEGVGIFLPLSYMFSVRQLVRSKTIDTGLEGCQASGAREKNEQRK